MIDMAVLRTPAPAPRPAACAVAPQAGVRAAAVTGFEGTGLSAVRERQPVTTPPFGIRVADSTPAAHLDNQNTTTLGIPFPGRPLG